jgi:predicted solute-binding protein
MPWKAKVPQAQECCCCGGEDEQPIQGVETLFVYDIAQQWREMTGLPSVLAIWVARRGVLTPEIASDFQASREYGLARIGEIAEGAALKLDLPPRELERYLTENIDFSLDEENLAGLGGIMRSARWPDLIPRARELEFVNSASVAR